jgi:hypothetical protein
MPRKGARRRVLMLRRPMPATETCERFRYKSSNFHIKIGIHAKQFLPLHPLPNVHAYEPD